MNPRIFVAAHKPYQFPEDGLHTPLQVGTTIAGDLHLGGEKDNSGDNISHKNGGFCELTGIYWAWRNLNSSEPIGFVHYRRYFGIKSGKHGLDHILKATEVTDLLQKAPVILPPQRNYFIETVKNQYANAHHLKDLEVARSVLDEKYPAFVAAFDKRMAGTKTHIYNMFIMRRDIFDQYCEWLFDVLFEVEKRLDVSSYSVSDARVFGYLGERLLDVWLDTTGTPYRETPVVFLERTNWIKKGTSFLIRKYLGTFRWRP